MNRIRLTPATTLRLPFSGTWFVVQGGDTVNVNHHMQVEAQWFGIDFARVDGPFGRELARQPAVSVEDCYSWNQQVLSPVDGLVVQATSDHPDNSLGTTDPSNPLGNHVEIMSPDGLFVFLAHLREGSVRVQAGERIQAGQVLGACGNSGNSTMPHIHLHVQNQQAFGNGTGQLPQFASIDVAVSGRVFKDMTWPLLCGMFVQPHEA